MIGFTAATRDRLFALYLLDADRQLGLAELLVIGVPVSEAFDWVGDFNDPRDHPAMRAYEASDASRPPPKIPPSSAARLFTS